MKKILLLSTILVVVLVGGAFLYFKWRHDFIRNQVPQLVFLKSDSLYTISYGDVYIDEIGGEVKISNLLLKPDSAFQREPGDKIPRVLLEVFIPVLHIKGLVTEQAMLNEEVIAHKLQLSNPVVTLYNNQSPDREKGSGFNTHGLYRAILRNLLRIKIDSIQIENARYNMVHWKSRDTILAGSPVNLHLYDLNISDSTSTDSTRVLFAKKAVVSVDSLFINNETRLYTYQISGIKLNSADKELTAEKIDINPRYGEEGFAKVAGNMRDRFDVALKNARFSQVDVNEVLNGNLVAESLTIRGSSMKIYRDKNVPRKDVNKVGGYPHQVLMRLPVDVSIKKVTVNSGYLEYKERSELTGEAGRVRFNNAALTITNLTNRPGDLKVNNVCRVAFTGRLLNAVPVSFNLGLYPADGKGRFTASGHAEGVDAAVFNELAKPMGMALIEAGRLNSLDFNMRGNDYVCDGTVRMLYEGFKIKLLGKDDSGDGFKKRGFLSFLANASIMDDNPKKNKPVRVAKVHYTRDVHKSLFNLVWKSIHRGILESVGIETTPLKTGNQ